MRLLFKMTLKFFLYFVLSFLNMKKTPVLKVLTHYSLKIIISVIHYQRLSKFSFPSFLCACDRSFFSSFIHSLRYSVSVNYLNILLVKFMVLIIPMYPGIIRRCLIILSADIQQA